jgi:uncharacterized protein
MIHDQTIPVFDQQVRALVGQLAKAAQWCSDSGTSEAELLDARLAPDMHPLAAQLNFVSAQMLQPIRRLAGVDLPDPPEADATIASHQQRLKAAAAAIADITPDALNIDPDRMVGMDLPNGMSFDLSAAAYVRDWALPQFWFHLMAAYSILRMRGVPIGKADFVPHMLKHLRKG